MPLAICLPLKPRSLNAKLKASYSSAIADAARAKHDGTILDVPLYSRIIWFHKYISTQGDIDNVAKRIHDALKNVLFEDDRVITHTIAIRVDASQEVEIVGDPENPDAELDLAEHLASAEHRDVLYVEIGRQIDGKIRLGPVS